MNKLVPKPIPVLGFRLTNENSFAIDLSTSNPSEEFKSVANMSGLGNYVDNQIKRHEGKYAFGGYKEKRTLYQSFGQFQLLENPREFHLGIDIWIPAGSPVYTPFDGEIVIANHIDLLGDYGGVIVVKHCIDGLTFHTLYGHLSEECIKNTIKGTKVLAGEQVGTIGMITENGGWPPHLHLQTIIDLGTFNTDYPGVCSRDEQSKYYNNCPDPYWLLCG